MELPKFRYHPNPIASGAIVNQDGTCACCEKDVDHLYMGHLFSIHDLEEKLCPWCIGSGEANATLNL